MPQMKNMNTESIYESSESPWRHVVGFVLSIILAALSLWTVLYSDVSMKSLVSVISIFAFLQAVRQLLYVRSHQLENER